MSKFMNAKFNSTCAQTGKQIKKDEHIYYVPGRGVFCETSDVYQDQREKRNIAEHIQANEDAYYDNFAAKNNI